MSLEREMVLGIDLGTTYSAVAKWDGRGPIPVEGRDGQYTTPSVVYYDPAGTEPTVGLTAIKRMMLNPENGIQGVKRHMDEGHIPLRVAGRELPPIEISADILRRVIGDALAQVPGSSIGSSVVTVPYYFRAHQCEGTRQAAKLADANCRAILQEPIAASLDYAFSQRTGGALGKDETVLVFDLGGGTFDLTLFRTETSAEKLRFEVLATGGDDRLGGMDFDARLTEVIMRKAGVDLSPLPERMQRKAQQSIWGAVQNAKLELTVAESTEVILPDANAKEPCITITRADFEDCISGYIDAIDALMRKTLIDGKIDASKVDRVIRVGGSSRIPAMKALLDRLIGADKVWSSREMDLTVSRGACLYAAFIDDPEIFGREVEVVTRTNHALGIEIKKEGFHQIIRANRKTPCEARQTFVFRPKELGEVLKINAYQGSGLTIADNTLIGTVTLDKLEAKPGSEIRVDVTFQIGIDQMLNVIVEANGRRITDCFKFA